MLSLKLQRTRLPCVYAILAHVSAETLAACLACSRPATTCRGYAMKVYQHTITNWRWTFGPSNRRQIAVAYFVACQARRKRCMHVHRETVHEWKVSVSQINDGMWGITPHFLSKPTVSCTKMVLRPENQCRDRTNPGHRLCFRNAMLVPLIPNVKEHLSDWASFRLDA